MSDINLTNDDPCLIHNLRGHRRPVLALVFHPSGKQLASCGADNSIMMWKTTESGIRCYDFRGHTDTVTSVGFSSNGQLMVSSSQDQTVRFWVPTIRGGSTDIRAHGAAVRTVALSPDNEQLLTGSNDKSLKLWNVQARRFLSSFLGHTNWVRCARFSPDGNLIASCADDRTLRIWDASTNQCIHSFVPSKGSGNYVAFHKNGNSVAIAMNTGSLRVYDIRSYKIIQHYKLHDNCTCVAWHPSAPYLLTSGMDGTIKIVDALEGRPLYTLQGHTTGINCVTFNHDGSQFASGGEDKHVMMWETRFITKPAETATSSVEMWKNSLFKEDSPSSSISLTSLS